MSPRTFGSTSEISATEPPSEETPPAGSETKSGHGATVPVIVVIEWGRLEIKPVGHETVLAYIEITRQTAATPPPTSAIAPPIGAIRRPMRETGRPTTEIRLATDPWCRSVIGSPQMP